MLSSYRSNRIISMKTTASIVCVGKWNPRIFTPNWVASNVFELPEGASMQINLDEESMALTYINNTVSFSVSETSLIISSPVNNIETLNYIDTIFKRIVSMLSHTPISAIGYNINLDLDNEESCNFEKFLDFKIHAVGNYRPSSLSLSCVKDFAQRSHNVRYKGSNIEIASNFQYNKASRLPAEGTAFDLIISDHKELFGYEF